MKLPCAWGVAHRVALHYIGFAGSYPAMALNVLWNRPCGPGGGTRRLHHCSRSYDRADGGETGSTRVVKTWLVLGMVPPLSG